MSDKPKEITCGEPIYANCSANQYKISYQQQNDLHTTCSTKINDPEAENDATNMYNMFVKVGNFTDGTNIDNTDSVDQQISAIINSKTDSGKTIHGVIYSLLCRLASASTQCVDTSDTTKDFMLWWQVNILGITPIENIVYFLSALTVLYINFKIIYTMVGGKGQFFDKVAPCISGASKVMFGQNTGGKMLPMVITGLVVFFIFVIVGGLLFAGDESLTDYMTENINVSGEYTPEISNILSEQDINNKITEKKQDSKLTDNERKTDIKNLNKTKENLERARIKMYQYRKLAMWVVVYASVIILVLSLILNKIESSNQIIRILSNLMKLISFGIIIAFNLFFTGIMPQLLLVALVGQRFLMGDYGMDTSSMFAILTSPVVFKLGLGALVMLALVGVSMYWNKWTVSTAIMIFIGITVVIGLCNYNSFYKRAKSAGTATAYWSLVLMPVFNYFMNITQSDARQFISPAFYGVANGDIF